MEEMEPVAPMAITSCYADSLMQSDVYEARRIKGKWLYNTNIYWKYYNTNQFVTFLDALGIRAYKHK